MKEFAGTVFQSIRKNGLVISDYLSSWANSSTGTMADSTGKSGSKFFFSSDKRYLVKTVSLQEVRWLLKILPAYVEVRY